MHPIPDSHPQSAWLHSLSVLLERTAYYGIRALIVLYMVSESIGMSNEEALWLYGVFAGAVIITKILGGLLGDLIFDHQNTIIAGGALLATGASILCIGTTLSLYIGIGMVAIGSGLYGPNLLASFGKQYDQQDRLLDAGFGLVYVAINLGAMAGGVFIGLAGSLNYLYGFGIAALCALLSIVPMIAIPNSATTTSFPLEDSKGNDYRGFAVMGVLILVSIFWGIYELTAFDLLNLEIDSSFLHDLGLPESIMIYGLASIGYWLGLLAGIGTVIVWSFYYSWHISKLAIGFSLAALAMVLFLGVSETSPDSKVLIWLFATLLLAISEVFIAPVTFAIIARYGSPAFMATLMSLVSLGSWILISIVGMAFDLQSAFPMLSVKIGIGVLGLISISLIIRWSNFSNQHTESIKEV